jgi:hypothetical protein
MGPEAEGWNPFGLGVRLTELLGWLGVESHSTPRVCRMALSCVCVCVCVERERDYSTDTLLVSNHKMMNSERQKPSNFDKQLEA